MTDPKKFFNDNVDRLSAEFDPVMWNMNNGLLALADVVVDIRRQLKQQQNTITDLRNRIYSISR